MLLNNSKYFIRKSSLVINVAPNTLFPKNAYYDLSDIVNDIVDGNNLTIGGGYLPLTLSENTTVATPYNLAVDGGGNLNFSKTTASQKAGLQAITNGGLLSALYWTDSAQSAKIRTILASEVNLQMVASDNISNSLCQVQTSHNVGVLRYSDFQDSTNTAAAEVRSSGVFVNGKAIKLEVNNTAPAISLIQLNSNEVEVTSSSDPTLVKNSVKTDQTKTIIIHEDVTIPANTAEVVVSSGEAKIVATLIKLVGVPTYADDTAAGVAGLTEGHLFHTGGQLFIKR